MAAAVVVATVVTTDSNEANCKDQLLEQVRRHDSDLRARLAAEGSNANVVSAVLNIEEFMAYAQAWSQRQKEEHEASARQEASATTVVTDGMSEFEFMEHTLQQLHNDETKSFVTLSDEDLETMEDEQIGEHFSRRPFRY